MKDKEIKDLIEQWEARVKDADKLADDAAGVGDWPTNQRWRIKAGVIQGMAAELKRALSRSNRYCLGSW